MDLARLPYIPGSDKKFDIFADKINRSGVWIDVFEVGTQCLCADEQVAGDLAGIHALCCQAEYFLLTGCQTGIAIRVGSNRAMRAGHSHSLQHARWIDLAHIEKDIHPAVVWTQM